MWEEHFGGCCRCPEVTIIWGGTITGGTGYRWADSHDIQEVKSKDLE